MAAWPADSLPLWPDEPRAGVVETVHPITAASLQHWAPEAWPVGAGWSPLVQAFLVSPDGRRLAEALQQRLAQGAVIYPPHPFRALRETPLDAVRVVILGQDPYHGPGQAEGLAFSVPDGVKLPPSLRNIFQELVRDLGAQPPASGSLLHWARQGVLLLNTSLTVEQGAPASHAKLGWERLTDALIHACSAHLAPKAFLLWGAHAQSKAPLIDTARHLVLSANHPSPLSARRPPQPFIGCGHFGRVNAWLQQKNEKPIAWL
ncbi:MAG TPA: uracil-DNA glycosylase [Macromonas sp.]|nr:uracil-DNA glycosylase [Macromonas sp.]